MQQLSKKSLEIDRVCNLYVQVDIFAEIGEIISGAKTLPRVPDCGKKFLLFKSLGNYAGESFQLSVVTLSGTVSCVPHMQD